MRSTSFDRFAGASAIGVGLGGIGYAAAFLVVLHSAPRFADGLRSVFLMLGGPLSVAVFTALYNRLREGTLLSLS